MSNGNTTFPSRKIQCPKTKKNNNKKKENKGFAWQALTIDLEAAFPGQFPVVPCPPPVGLSPFYSFRTRKQANCLLLTDQANETQANNKRGEQN